MAKKNIKSQIKLYVSAGQANPAPPVGPALGQHGVNIMQFCKSFNEQTKGREGLVLPVIIRVYEDKSFDFTIKTPPSSVLIKRACNLAKASGQTGKEKIAQITFKQIEEIAKKKMEDLNTSDLEEAVKIVCGTARSMGIEVVEQLDPNFVPPPPPEDKKAAAAPVAAAAPAAAAAPKPEAAKEKKEKK
jgi:large subunit ribosomal protein L11